MHEHGRALIRAVVQESHNSSIIQILVSNVIANLHAQMPRLHASAKLLASGINILQRHLAKGFQPALSRGCKAQAPHR